MTAWKVLTLVLAISQLGTALRFAEDGQSLILAKASPTCTINGEGSCEVKDQNTNNNCGTNNDLTLSECKNTVVVHDGVSKPYIGEGADNLAPINCHFDKNWGFVVWNDPPNGEGGTRYYYYPICKAASANGDPYFRNLQGELFDVMQTGRMLLLEVSPSSGSTDRELGIEADIERLGVSECGPTYITQVFLNGSWLDTPVSIRSGHAHMRKPFGVQFGSEDWIPHAEFLGQKTGMMQVGKSDGKEDAVVMTVEGVEVRVQQPKRPRVFLDVSIAGLRNVKGDIGGLLGNGNHEEATKLPKDCDSKQISDDERAGTSFASL